MVLYRTPTLGVMAILDFRMQILDLRVQWFALKEPVKP
jgi:hypothetical protein